MNLRIDRIKKLKVLDEPARPCCEVSQYKTEFDSADYAAKMFNMFSGQNENIVIECEIDLREEIMDRFGANIPLTAVDLNHFKTEFYAAVSDGLVSWLMQFGNKIKVISPVSVVNMIKEKAENISKVYSE